MHLFNEQVLLHNLTFNDTQSFCEKITQVPEDLMSNMTCFAPESKFDLMVSDLKPFCAYDFTSKVQVDEVQKRVGFSLTYTIEGTSRPEIHESQTQFSNTIVAEVLGEMLGEDSVDVIIHRETDNIDVVILTKHHADLEDRLKHKWFLMRLQEKLQKERILIELNELDYKGEIGEFGKPITPVSNFIPSNSPETLLSQTVLAFLLFLSF